MRARRPSLGSVAVAFSFVFQAHIGFGVVLVPLMIVTVVCLSLQSRRDDRAITRRELGAGVAAASPHSDLHSPASTA